MTQIFLAMLIGLACAVIAVTMIVIMPNEPILNWWFRFGQKVGIKKVQGDEVERWFYKPIWGCEKCFAGQLSMWWYLIWHFKAQRGQGCPIPGWRVGMYGYSVFCHLTAVCAGIMIAVLLSKHIIKKTQDNE